MTPCDCPQPARCAQLAVCQAKCGPLGPDRDARIVSIEGDRVRILERLPTGPSTPYVEWPGPGVRATLAGTSKGRWP